MADSIVYGSIALYLCTSLLIFDLSCCEIGSDDSSCLKTEDNNCSFQDFSSVEVTSRDVEAISGPHKNLYSSNHSTCSSENGSNFCSAWHYCDNGECTCGKVPNDILHCSKKGNLSVLDTFCVTFNASQGLTEAGNCIFNVGIHMGKDFSENIHSTLPKIPSELNEVMCGNWFNRNGTLCGKCKDGYFPKVYSFNMTCVKCPYGRANWWKFVLSAFLPLAIFYFIVVLFKLNVTSSHLHGFIYYSQAISMPALVRSLRLHSNYLTIWKYVGSLYGIWNLDFFRSFDLGICLGTDTLQTLSLDIAVAIYPLLLMMLSYVLIDLYDRNFRFLVILWKPFLRVFSLFHRNWGIRTSVIDAFATFFFLSNVKFLSVSFDLLAPVKVYQLSSSNDFNYTWRLYFDATIPYFGETHLPYAILAIVTLFVFVFTPVLLLLLYPFQWFQKLLNLFPFRWYILHTFMDSFYGCYKNGTELGTRDCRWFVSLFYIVRILGLIIGLFTFNMMFFIFGSMCLVLFAILMMNIRPFKTDFSHYTDINVIFIILLASCYVTMAGIDIASFRNHDMIWIFNVITLTFGILPLLFILVIILYQIFKHRKFGFELIRRMHALRHGYDWWTLE